MTAYLETHSVAHVMEWEARPYSLGWRPICRVRWRMPILQPSVYHDRDDWPLRFTSDGQPTKPWCRYCAATLALRVREAVNDVLRHAAGWETWTP